MALKGCCCCCRLREGALSIGITFLVLTLLGVAFSVPTWVQLADEQERMERMHAEGDAQADVQAGRTLKIVIALRVVDIVLSVLFNSLLIHGVRRSVPGMLLAWMIYYAIAFTLCSIAGVVLTIGGIVIAAVSSNIAPAHVAGLELVPAVGAAIIVGGLLLLGLTAFFWYLWAVVLTYHRELREQGGAYKRELLMEESPPAYESYPQA